jgi:hypothetical protein
MAREWGRGWVGDCCCCGRTGESSKSSSQLSWLVSIVVVVFIFVVILLLLFVIIRFLGVTCGGDEGGEGNPPRPVLDHSCTERRFDSVSQSSENVELDADTRGGCLTR